MKDLCQITETLERRFRTGLIYEELIELTEDAELFHVERVEAGRTVIARTMCRPLSYGTHEIKRTTPVSAS